MPADQLTETQKIMLAKLIHRALVDIRILGWQGAAQQAADLADAMESLPCEMAGIWIFQWRHLRNNLESYQKKHPKYTHQDYVAEVDRIRKAG